MLSLTLIFPREPKGTIHSFSRAHHTLSAPSYYLQDKRRCLRPLYVWLFCRDPLLFLHQSLLENTYPHHGHRRTNYCSRLRLWLLGRAAWIARATRYLDQGLRQEAHGRAGDHGGHPRFCADRYCSQLRAPFSTHKCIGLRPQSRKLWSETPYSNGSACNEAVHRRAVSLVVLVHEKVNLQAETKRAKRTASRKRVRLVHFARSARKK